MKQMNSKKKKKRSKFGAGIDVGAAGKGYEQSKAVFDSMHHENSAVYGG
jgi:hypothetical protein